MHVDSPEKKTTGDMVTARVAGFTMIIIYALSIGAYSKPFRRPRLSRTHTLRKVKRGI